MFIDNVIEALCFFILFKLCFLGSETTMLSPRIIIEAGPYYYNVFREKLDILKTSVCEAAEQGYSVLQSEVNRCIFERIRTLITVFLFTIIYLKALLICVK